MFTGLIEDVGTVAEIKSGSEGSRLRIASRPSFDHTRTVGDRQNRRHPVRSHRLGTAVNFTPGVVETLPTNGWPYAYLPEQDVAEILRDSRLEQRTSTTETDPQAIVAAQQSAEMPTWTGQMLNLLVGLSFPLACIAGCKPARSTCSGSRPPGARSP